MDTYDLVIIGGGPGGYVAALRAAETMNVLLVEDRQLGGTCLNWGCIPAKTFIETSHIAVRAGRAREFGLKEMSPEVDMPALVKRKQKVVKTLVGGIAGLMKKRKVEVVTGRASFVDAKTIEITPAEGEPRKVRTEKTIIATGSRPVRPGFLPWDDKRVMTSYEIFDWTEKPESVMILGAGIIGCEFVSLYANLGINVTVVEMMDRVLPTMAPEVGKEMTKAFKKAGVKVLTGKKLEGIDTSGDKLLCKVEGTDDVESDIALIAIGRKPYTEGLGLENTDVVVAEDGSVQINEYAQTAVASIYAIGDVNGHWPLAHAASHQGLVAVEHMQGGTRTIDDDYVPACIFTDPQIGAVGMNEQQATEAGYDVHTATFPFQASGRALTEGATEGFVKLVGVKRTGRILGCQIVGAQATELVQVATVAIRNQLTVTELAHTVFPHPTLSETIMEAAEGFLGHGIHG